MKTRPKTLLHPEQNLFVFIHGMSKQFDRFIDLPLCPVITEKYQAHFHPDPVGRFRANAQERAVIAAEAYQKSRWNREHDAGIAFFLGQVRMADKAFRYPLRKTDTVAEMAFAGCQVRT